MASLSPLKERQKGQLFLQVPEGPALTERKFKAPHSIRLGFENFRIEFKLPKIDI